eukprot:TRINITY_DN1361_c0_g1_i1.p1 TRINITY_DN1361_c0_g1~~TRINITY_DN1361_c0_g1_i1.p1  ORF type:complete len:308 (+),score=64.74 TRINITY_DN1361_c0_g1_i1:165-1088(+)
MGQNGSSDERGKINKFDKLSNEVIIHILTLLPLKDLCMTITRVCKRLKTLSESDEIWDPLYRRAFKDVLIAKDSHNFKKLYMLEMLSGHQISQRFSTKPQKKASYCGNCEGKLPTQPSSNQADYLHFKQEEMGRSSLNQGCKLVILGDINTGKTSILIRLVRNQFNITHDATIGASFLIKHLVVDNTPVKMEIWDTAGAERYHSLAPMFYRGALAALIVYDITSIESFRRASLWIEEVEKIKNPPLLVLIGNKSDLDAKRAVSQSSAQKLAKEHDMLFRETSAKDNLGVTDAFMEIAHSLIQKSETN